MRTFATTVNQVQDGFVADPGGYRRHDLCWRIHLRLPRRRGRRPLGSIMLRPGNARSNTAAEHIEAAALALALAILGR